MEQKMEVGFHIPEITKFVTQEDINKYAEVSEDFNPLHVDPEYAKTTQFKGIIAHGLMSLAYISEMMGTAFGDGWLCGGDMDVKFLAPVRPGEQITVWGVVKEKKIIDNCTTYICDVGCVNQEGVKVIKGTASAVSE